jgi:hypothetical protein
MKRALVFVALSMASVALAFAEHQGTPTVVNPAGYQHGLGAENPSAPPNQPVPRPKKPKKSTAANAASAPAEASNTQ